MLLAFDLYLAHFCLVTMPALLPHSNKQPTNPKFQNQTKSNYQNTPKAAQQ